MCGLKMTNWHNSCEDIIYKNITDVHWLHKINQLKKTFELRSKSNFCALLVTNKTGDLLWINALNIRK